MQRTGFLIAVGRNNVDAVARAVVEADATSDGCIPSPSVLSSALGLPPSRGLAVESNNLPPMGPAVLRGPVDANCSAFGPGRTPVAWTVPRVVSAVPAGEASLASMVG